MGDVREPPDRCPTCGSEYRAVRLRIDVWLSCTDQWHSYADAAYRAEQLHGKDDV